MVYPIIHHKINWRELSLNPVEIPLLHNPIVNPIAIPMLQSYRADPIYHNFDNRIAG